MKNLILASTSTVHGAPFLSYLDAVLAEHFKACNEVLFIPFARPGGATHDAYTAKAAVAFNKLGKKLIGIHTFENKKKAIEEAQAIFTGGGNTFVLLDQLYKHDLIAILRSTLLKGTPYLGTSAGTNICGLTVGTTNDMPIVYPPTFEALKLVPFNINPHYLDPDPTSTHMGETRETRINEFHHFNKTPVIGLREGSYIKVSDEHITLLGPHQARWFEANKNAIEINSGTVLSSMTHS